mmetsp:Transcript_107/g.204  ORF Transcript_107/g.204 Transcript_107/m.204 type:complete len:206 (-) Transcript_107:715-1332(-)
MRVLLVLRGLRVAARDLLPEGLHRVLQKHDQLVVLAGGRVPGRRPHQFGHAHARGELLHEPRLLLFALALGLAQLAEGGLHAQQLRQRRVLRAELIPGDLEIGLEHMELRVALLQVPLQPPNRQLGLCQRGGLHSQLPRHLLLRLQHALEQLLEPIRRNRSPIIGCSRCPRAGDTRPEPRPGTRRDQHVTLLAHALLPSVTIHRS